MALYKKTDQAPEKETVVITLYGEPGCFKTSLALTSLNPVLIDFDGGLWRAHGIDKVDKFIMEGGWHELERNIDDGMFDEHQTIITDTAKTALDNYLAPAIMEENPSMKSAAGGLTPGGYGALSQRFKESYIRKFKGKVLIFIAHEKEESESDYTTYKPDITGGTYGIIMQMSDLVMWVHKENDKVVLRSENSSRYISKDRGISTLEVPHYSDPSWEGFFQREVIAKVILSLSLNVKKTEDETMVANEWIKKIAGIGTLEEMNTFVRDIKALESNQAIKSLVTDKMVKHAKSNGWQKVKGKHEFEKVS